MATPSGSAASQSPAIALVAAAGRPSRRSPSPFMRRLSRGPRRRAAGPERAAGSILLAMATCTGAVAESPDDPFWKIPLDKCDKSIDAIDVKAGFVSKWSICGGAKSFEVTLDPRAVIVSSDAIHCSNTPSEVSVTFIGPPKK